MKTFQIREMDPTELRGKIEEKAEELANLNFQLALHQLDDTSKVRIARREFARMITIMREHDKGIRRLSDRIEKPNEEIL